MVVISQALETAIAVILFVVLVIIFFQVFGASECDTFANTTAVEITDAINKVALEDGVYQWTADSIPSDEDTNYYVPVPIRLCQRNPLDVFLAQFSAQMPEYILTYETFPEPGIAWSESQPFSGGAAESVLNYAVFKYGIKSAIWIAGFGTKLVTRIVTTAGSTIKTLLLRSGKQVLRDKLVKYWDSFVENRYIKGFLSKLGASKTLSSTEETVDDVLNSRYYSKKGADLIEEVRGKTTTSKGIEFEKALVEAGFFEEGKDGLAELNKQGKKIVNQNYRDVAYELIENSKDADFKNSLYIPPKYPWLSEIPEKYFQPLKNAITGSRAYKTAKTYLYEYPKKLYDKITGAYEDAKAKFNRVFNYKEGMVNPKIVVVEYGVLKKVAIGDLDEFRKGIKNADNIDEILTAIKKITGETIDNVDDLTDQTLSKLASRYQIFQSTQDLAKFIPREQIELTGLASQKIGSEIKEVAEKIKASADPSAEYNNLRNLFDQDWAYLTGTQKQEWIKKFSEGYTKNGVPLEIDIEKAREVYDYARASMISEGLLDSTQAIHGGNVRTSWILKKADNVQADMIENKFFFENKYQGSSLIDEFLIPIVAEDNLDKITERKALSYGWERIKRGVMLDMNRIGLNPVNIIPSPYSVKVALEKETEIKEGGCAANSICKIQRGLASGPTESTSVYLLDEKVPDSIEVKLWRPNPSVGAGELGLAERTPAGLNTILFSTSVTENPRFYVTSPCFGIAKVWKNGDTVFVTVDKNRKCDVGGCDQAAVTLNLTASPISIPFVDLLPFVDEVKTPGVGLGVITIGMENIDTPNYCYADEGLIWGDSDSPSQVTYYASYATCTAFCGAASAAFEAGVGIRQCLKLCEYPVIGLIMFDTFSATQAYRDVSSWERQDTGWGYWNYQKATDICDNIDMIASVLGSTPKSGGFLENRFFKTSIGSKVWVAGSKINKFAGIGVDELCYGIQVMGDTSLSWPIKTPAGEIWRKATTLTESCMKESVDECVWIERCTGNGDCPEGLSCVDNECKEV